MPWQGGLEVEGHEFKSLCLQKDFFSHKKLACTISFNYLKQQLCVVRRLSI